MSSADRTIGGGGAAAPTAAGTIRSIARREGEWSHIDPLVAASVSQLLEHLVHGGTPTQLTSAETTAALTTPTRHSALRLTSAASGASPSTSRQQRPPFRPLSNAATVSTAHRGTPTGGNASSSALRRAGHGASFVPHPKDAEVSEKVSQRFHHVATVTTAVRSLSTLKKEFAQIARSWDLPMVVERCDVPYGCSPTQSVRTAVTAGDPCPSSGLFAPVEVQRTKLEEIAILIDSVHDALKHFVGNHLTQSEKRQHGINVHTSQSDAQLVMDHQYANERILRQAPGYLEPNYNIRAEPHLSHYGGLGRLMSPENDVHQHQQHAPHTVAPTSPPPSQPPPSAQRTSALPSVTPASSRLRSPPVATAEAAAASLQPRRTAPEAHMRPAAQPVTTMQSAGAPPSIVVPERSEAPPAGPTSQRGPLLALTQQVVIPTTTAVAGRSPDVSATPATERSATGPAAASLATPNVVTGHRPVPTPGSMRIHDSDEDSDRERSDAGPRL